MSRPPSESPPINGPSSGFLRGMRAVLSSILGMVLFFTFIGVGALTHDAGFTLGWTIASTVLVWAAPAQIILVATSHAGATLLESAIAVTISAVRLLPMVVAILPMLRMPDTKMRQLVLPAHMIAVTAWVESVRLLPDVPREQRIGFVNGLGCGLIGISCIAATIGFGLAANLPPLLAAGILALTPLVFLFSTARNARHLVDKLALAFGLALYPLISLLDTGVDMLISGLAAGTLAYAAHRWRRRA